LWAVWYPLQGHWLGTYAENIIPCVCVCGGGGGIGPKSCGAKFRDSKTSRHRTLPLSGITVFRYLEFLVRNLYLCRIKCLFREHIDMRFVYLEVVYLLGRPSAFISEGDQSVVGTRIGPRARTSHGTSQNERQEGPPRDADSRLAIRDISGLLRNPMVRYRVH
jgi:hypothetical protein